MKTFETEKHNIPEGATHYVDEQDGSHFCWFDIRNDKAKIYVLDGSGFDYKWHKCTNGYKHYNVKPIPQTKDAEWVNGLPPVGALCLVNRDPFTYRVMYSSEYVVIVQNLDNDNTTDHGMDIILDMCKGNYTFRKPETEAEKLERERLEAVEEMFTFWSDDNSDFVAGDDDDRWVRELLFSLYDAGYRKEVN